MFIFLHLKIFQSSFFATLLQCFEWLQVQLNVQTFQERKFLHFPNCSLFFCLKIYWLWKKLIVHTIHSYATKKIQREHKKIYQIILHHDSTMIFFCVLCVGGEREWIWTEKKMSVFDAPPLSTIVFLYDTENWWWSW